MCVCLFACVFRDAWDLLRLLGTFSSLAFLVPAVSSVVAVFVMHTLLSLSLLSLSFSLLGPMIFRMNVKRIAIWQREEIDRGT